MFASDEIYGKVARVLVEALGVDEDEITPAATLQGDLGAESIDMLDIVFRLEARVRGQDPARRAVPRVGLPGKPRVRAGRPGDRRRDA